MAIATGPANRGERSLSEGTAGLLVDTVGSDDVGSVTDTVVEAVVSSKGLDSPVGIDGSPFPNTAVESGA